MSQSYRTNGPEHATTTHEEPRNIISVISNNIMVGIAIGAFIYSFANIIIIFSSN